jgi:hypothetical protein
MLCVPVHFCGCVSDLKVSCTRKVSRYTYKDNPNQSVTVLVDGSVLSGTRGTYVRR